MIVTTYTCDKCGYAQKNSDQNMYIIGIAVKENNPRYTPILKVEDFPKNRELWCRKCVEQIGLLPHPMAKPPPEPVPETLEDKIYEIVGEAIQAEKYS